MNDRPAGSIDRPAGTDPLSEVLRAVRLTGGMFLEARFTAPWCVLSKVDPEDCQPSLANPPLQVIAYHYVVEGRMLVGLEGQSPVEVCAGETVLLPRNDPHVLCSSMGSMGLRPIYAHELIQAGDPGGLLQIVHGGGGEVTRIICGFLGSDQDRNPLIATLPRILTVDMGRARSSEWIESSLRFAIQGLQQGAIGTSTVVSRLSELMFVEAVRCYAAGLPAEQRGWLAGIRDPVVGRALALVHGSIDRRCTAESLARHVALSRSAFADRFTALVGMPPKRYLTFWRMQAAKDKLREGRKPIAQIAYEVGYEAEAAFIRAFKREFGVPPATWRRQGQSVDPGADPIAPSP
ncbi:AraC family transcriptional regulator [Inquilinus limosus]|uniref:AraC family transcriptional regulator n=1 Tax=Inquilinus limosus TaxID=171674 RepID=UPI003F15115C